MTLTRYGTALENMTSGHRGINAGSAFCWLYDAWARGNAERGIEALPPDAVVVEVGNGGLHSLGYLCDVAPPGWTIYALDPYLGGGRFRGFIQDATDYLGDVIERVRFARMPSPQIARFFDAESVDAVLIDGDHDYLPVKRDIASWWHKIRPNGWLAGDDVDPMFPGCEAAWSERFDRLTVYGSTAVVQKKVGRTSGPSDAGRVRA